MSTDPRYEEKRQWRLSHPESVKASNRKQYLNRIDMRRAYDKAYRKKNRDRIRARMKIYAANRYRERRSEILAATKLYAQTHPEVRRRCHVNYKRKHPDRWRAQNSAGHITRRARMARAHVADSAVNHVIRQWRMDRYFVCYYCQERFLVDRLHVDHIIPISRGGKHTIQNICKSCDDCNQHKHCSTPDRIKVEQPLLCL